MASPLPSVCKRQPGTDAWRGVKLTLLLLVVLHTGRLAAADDNLECGPGSGRRIELNGNTGWACNRATCAGRCVDITPPDENPLCYCDQVCMTRGDCCFDYRAICVEGRAFSGNLTGEYPLHHEARHGAACLKADGMYVMAMTQCASDYSGDRELCENATFTSISPDLFQFVYSDKTQIFYKNIHCAGCNGVPTEDLHLMPLIIDCNDPSNVANKNKRTKKLVSMYREGSISQFLSYFQENCKLKVLQRRVPSYPIHRKCKSRKFVSFQGCHDYSSPVKFGDSSILGNFSPLQSNSFCYTSRFDDFQAERVCCLKSPASYGEKVEPVSVLGLIQIAPDSSMRYDQRPVCVPGQVEDIVSSGCVDEPCQADELLLPDASCLSLSNEPSPMLSSVVPSRIYHDQLIMTVRPTKPPSEVPTSLAAALRVTMFATVGPNLQVEVKLQPCALLEEELEGKRDGEEGEGGETCVLINFFHAPTHKIFENLHQSTLQRNVLESVETTLGEIQSISIVNYDDATLQCPDGQLMWVDNGMLLRHAVMDVEFLQMPHPLSVYDAQGKVNYQVQTVAVHLTWFPNSSIDEFFQSKWQSRMKFAVCRGKVDLMSCPKLAFSQFNYDDQGSRRVFYIGEGDGRVRMSLQEDEFLIWKGELIVCEDSYTSGDVLEQSEEMVIVFYSLIGVAILTLAVTSINLLVVHNKLYLAEKLAFHHSTRLLLAHVSLVAGRAFVTWPGGCRALAIIQHVFLLSAFAAHAAFGVETSCRFITMCTMSSARCWAWRSKLYIEGTFFLALALVGILNLDATDGVVSYGSLYDGMSCRVKPFEAELYFLAVPLGIAISICLCYYMACGVVRISPFCTVNPENGVYGQHRQLSLASLKMSGLMLLTWVCYFLKDQHPALFYVYCAGNCLQGLSFFVDFVLRRLDVDLTGCCARMA